MRWGTPLDLSGSYDTTPELPLQSPFRLSASARRSQRTPAARRSPARHARTLGPQELSSRTCGPTESCVLRSPLGASAQPLSLPPAPSLPSHHTSRPELPRLPINPNYTEPTCRRQSADVAEPAHRRHGPRQRSSRPRSGDHRGPPAAPSRTPCPSAAQGSLEGPDETRVRQLPRAQGGHENRPYPEPVGPQDVREYLIPDGTGGACGRPHHHHRPPKGDRERLPGTGDNGEAELRSDLSDSPPAGRIAHQTPLHPLFVRRPEPPAHLGTEVRAVPVNQCIVQVQDEAPHPFGPERVQVYLPNRSDQEPGRQ